MRGGYPPSTLHNNLSIFRTFAEWVGKAGMVRGIEHYLGSGTTARSSIASQDRTWSGQGVDVAAKIEQVRQKDVRVALQLQLQLAFGLRASFGLTLPAREHGGVDALAAQERPKRTRRLAAVGLGEQRALLPGGVPPLNGCAPLRVESC